MDSVCCQRVTRRRGVQRVPPLAACLFCLMLVAAPLAAQQPAPTADFQVHVLARARAADAHAMLSRMLTGLGEQADVVVDAENNRLLVRGNPEVQRLTRDLVASIERTAAPAPATPPRPVLQSYPFDSTAADTVAQRVQALYPPDLGIRVVADPRIKQMLVLAPVELHGEIRDRIHATAASIAAASATPPAAAAPHATLGQPTALAQQPMPQQGLGQAATNPPPAAARLELAPLVDAGAAHFGDPASMQLQRASVDEVAAALGKLWGARMVGISGGPSDIVSYAVRLSNGEILEIHLDRRTSIVTIRGSRQLIDPCLRIVQAIDRGTSDPANSTRVAPVRNTEPARVRQAIAMINNQTGGAAAARAVSPEATSMVSQLFQNRRAEDAQQATALLAQNQAQPQQPQQQPAPAQQVPPGAELIQEILPGGQGDFDLVGPVQIYFDEALGTIIITGNQADVDKVMRIIEQIEQISQVTAPKIEVVPLRFANSSAVATLINELYETALQPRYGVISVTALVRPNAILLIGRAESVDTVRSLIGQLDQPTDPSSEFRVFPLKHASAATLQTTITEFFTDPTGLGTRVVVTADTRGNAIIVQASPRDLAEVAELVRTLDTSTSEAVHELRVFALEHATAADLAPVLQEAVTGAAAAGQVPGQQGAAAAAKSTMLQLLTIDREGQQRYSSGILSDARITANEQANTILVSAPADGMPLIEALIREMDQPPQTISQVKVFTIVNGDAYSLAQTLAQLFGTSSTTGANFGGGIGALGGGAAGQQTATMLRFSVDLRTNSIIASGTTDDLTVVEAILFRLDEGDIRERQYTVYKLRNAPADFVAAAISEFLASESDIDQSVTGVVSYAEQLERDVTVVAETVTNNLVISATPQFFQEIMRIIEQLDARPPMVMVQVLIAEVTLNNTDEFGVELGLQDSALFDRSLLGDLVEQTVTTQQAVPGGGTITTTNQRILGASNTPGYNWNQQVTGNSGSDSSLATRNDLAGQALANFGVGRINPSLGYGGLVLSAASESVNILIRALQESRRLDVLARPQIMTLDNNYAYVQVGQRVPRIAESSVQVTGQVNSIELIDVGLILGITPRITPEGLVVMQVDAEKSALGPEAEGIPVSFSTDGTVIRSPRIDTTTASTVISAMDGQTVVLGGLITRSTTNTSRRVPILSQIPILGHLFRYDAVSATRTELLIILTPRVVRNEGDAELVKQVEAARMSWCLADVIRTHGDIGVRSRTDEWSDAETMTYYPDNDPTGQGCLIEGEILPEGAVLPEGAMPIEIAPEETLPMPLDAGPALSPQGASAAPNQESSRTTVRPAQPPRLDASPANAPVPIQNPASGDDAVRASTPVAHPTPMVWTQDPRYVPAAASAPILPPSQTSAQPIAPSVPAPTAQSVSPAYYQQTPIPQITGQPVYYPQQQ